MSLTKQLLFFNLAWDDHYVSISPTSIQFYLSGFVNINSSGNYYLYNCNFLNLSSTVIVMKDIVDSIILVESSFFMFCGQTSSPGGVLYFCNIEQGQSVFCKTCGSYCVSAVGQFINSDTQYGLNYKNQFIMSSIYQCSPYYMQSNAKSSSIRLGNGNCSVNEVNSSYNLCSTASGVQFSNPSHSYIIFSTFFNCTSNLNTIFSFFYQSNEFLFVNVINCLQKDDGYGLIRNYDATANFNNCCFDNNRNTGNNIFSHTTSGTTSFQNCYIQEGLNNIGNVVFTENHNNSNSHPYPMINYCITPESTLKSTPHVCSYFCPHYPLFPFAIMAIIIPMLSNEIQLVYKHVNMDYLIPSII